MNNQQKTERDFFCPPARYRGLPFWAWNGLLNEKTLKKQIRDFKRMGFGGFVIHPREGLKTPYLGREFLACVKACAEYAHSLGLTTWLYDEDRYPSGVAGGFVTENPAYARKFLYVTKEATGETPYAVFSLTQDETGKLLSYRQSGGGECVYYFYLRTAEGEARFNGKPYADVMNADAVRCFLQETHERYLQLFGGEFPPYVEAIFTDEPYVGSFAPLKTPFSRDEGYIPWTEQLPVRYEQQFGQSLQERLPELLWEGDGCARTRYCYRRILCELFNENYLEQISAWCKQHGILFTGHLDREDSPNLQCRQHGDVMSGYGYFDLPGFDVLCDARQYVTAKQTQSAARQYAKGGVTCELFGVTDWTFDFSSFKAQGDFYTALGMSRRVPHHALMTLRGAAKRDYPAPISCQSSWYKKFALLENHFARVNCILGKGGPYVKVGIVHPAESYWLSYGPDSATEGKRKALDEKLNALTKWLLFCGVDFDFIDEDILQRDGARILARDYERVLLPENRTLRASTVQYLTQVAVRGGKVYALGSLPGFLEGVPHDFSSLPADVIPFTRSAVLAETQRYAPVKLYYGKRRAHNVICDVRYDGDDVLLFACRAHKGGSDTLRMRLKGQYEPVLYDTLQGRKLSVPFRCAGGETEISAPFFAGDSLLLRLKKTQKKAALPPAPKKVRRQIILTPEKLTLTERNVLLLDVGEFTLRGKTYESGSLFVIDKKCRETCNLPPVCFKDVQPWCDETPPSYERGTLRFSVFSDRAITGVELAFENALSVKLNGVRVRMKKCGTYVDEGIFRMALPALRKGENRLEITVPFGRRSTLEPMYLIGDFGVKRKGDIFMLTALGDNITYGSVTEKGLPFYGGNLDYCYRTVIGQTSDAVLQLAPYHGALCEIFVDGKSRGEIISAPYECHLPLTRGEHRITVRLYANRHNTFGSLHNRGGGAVVPMHFFPSEENYTKEHLLIPVGLTRPPKLYSEEKETL